MFGRKRQDFCRGFVHVCLFLVFCTLSSTSFAQNAISPSPSPAPQPASPAPAPTPPAPNNNADKTDSPKADNQKVVTNPFTPGGVTNGDQGLSRAEVEKLLAEQETRLKKEMNGGMNADEISKMIASATTSGSALNPDNFIGCVNGVPLYRVEDGTLTLGTKEPEEMKAQRCGK